MTILDDDERPDATGLVPDATISIPQCGISLSNWKYIKKIDNPTYFSIQ